MRASAAGIATGLLVVLLCLWRSAVYYKQALALARRGVYPFPRDKRSVKAASKFIGFQAAQIGVGFVFVWFVVCALVMVLSIPLVWRTIRDVLATVLLSLASASLAIAVLETLVLGYVLTRKDTIVYRRLYMLADLWFSMVS